MGSNEKTFAIITLAGILGVVSAIILQLLYDQHIIIDEVITSTLTLGEVQLFVILIWEVLGIVVAAIGQ